MEKNKVETNKEEVDNYLNHVRSLKGSIYISMTHTSGKVEWYASADRKMWKSFQDIIRTENYLEILEDLRDKYVFNHKGDVWSDGEKKQIRSTIDKFICEPNGLSESYVDIIISDLEGIPDPKVFDNSYGLCGIIETEDSSHPISLKISPYASKRDILDWVTKAYKPLIKPIQEKHAKSGITMGRRKSKMSGLFEIDDSDDIAMRNDFIYENREMSLKTIRKWVFKRFAYRNNPDIFRMDDGHVGKIISLEKKKRMKV